jgi:hypothetical protein
MPAGQRARCPDRAAIARLRTQLGARRLTDHERAEIAVGEWNRAAS